MNGRSIGLGLAGWPLGQLIRAAGTGLPLGRCVLGFDIGGTKVHAVLVGSDGSVAGELVRSTRAATNGQLLDQVADMHREIVAATGVNSTDVVAAGIGLPGIVDPVTGVVGLSPNAPGAAGTGLAAEFAKALGIPVDIDNDVNLAAAAERWRGAAADLSDFVLLNIGTGIGAGLVLGGEIYRGRHGGAGEIAHLPLDGDGYAGLRQDASFEQVAAPAGLVARSTRLVVSGPDGARAPDNARQVVESAVRGDPVATRALAEHLGLLSAALAIITALIDPAVVVLGGGFGRNPHVVETLRAAVADSDLPLEITASALGNRGGALGAALLAHAVVLDRPSAC